MPSLEDRVEAIEKALSKVGDEFANLEYDLKTDHDLTGSVDLAQITSRLRSMANALENIGEN